MRMLGFKTIIAPVFLSASPAKSGPVTSTLEIRIPSIFICSKALVYRCLK